MPPPRVPLDCETLIREGCVETPIRCPGNWILESWFRNPPSPKGFGADTLQWSAVPGTASALVENPPNLLNPRLASPSDLVDHGLDIIGANSLFSDHGCQHGSQMPRREQRGEINDGSRDRRDRKIRYLRDVTVQQIMASVNGHSGKCVCRSRMNEHGRGASSQLRNPVQFGGRIMRHDRFRQRSDCGSNEIHGPQHLDDLISEASERSPSPVPDPPIDLAFREAAIDRLIMANRPTLGSCDSVRDSI